MEKEYKPIYAVGEPQELLVALDELFIANPGFCAVMAKLYPDLVLFLQSLLPNEKYYLTIARLGLFLQPNQVSSPSPSFSRTLKSRLM